MGVTAAFTKQTCHRIFLKDNDDKWLGDKHHSSVAEFPPPTSVYLYDEMSDRHHSSVAEFRSKRVIVVDGSPKQFRDLNARGLDIAVTFTPIKPDGVVVEYSHVLHPPRIDFRFETNMNVYKLPAKVHRIEYFFAGGKSPFRVDEFN